MLRRLNESLTEPPPASSEAAAFPSLELPFVLEDRPCGIRFYQGRTSFFHPYALLQSMRYNADTLTLVFVDADVVLRGRGLHELYVRLAGQRVAWVVEQGDRYAVASDAAVHISRIEHTPHPAGKHSQQQQ